MSTALEKFAIKRQLADFTSTEQEEIIAELKHAHEVENLEAGDGELQTLRKQILEQSGHLTNFIRAKTNAN